MKKLSLSIFLTAGLTALFVFGLLSGNTGPLMAAFCLWTPAAWFLGYSLASAGIRVTIQNGSESPVVPLNERTIHRKPNSSAARANRDLA